MRDIYFWKEKLEGRDELGEGGRGEVRRRRWEGEPKGGEGGVG